MKTHYVAWVLVGLMAAPAIASGQDAAQAGEVWFGPNEAVITDGINPREVVFTWNRLTAGSHYWAGWVDQDDLQAGVDVDAESGEGRTYVNVD